MKQLYTFFVLTFLTFTTSFSQILESKGTRFYLGFPDGYNTSTTRYINIYGPYAATGAITSPNGLNTPFSIVAGGMTTITIPSAYNITTNQTVQDLGLIISSSDSIIVNASSIYSGGGDAVAVLPYQSLGLEHYVLTHANLRNSSLLVVGTANGTSVTIVPSVATAGGNAAGSTINITLNEGQTYYMESSTTTGDLTGTMVSSSDPVAVFGHNKCVNVPTSGTVYCDFSWEQTLTTAHLGTEFVAGLLGGRSNPGDMFKVVATVNSTTININGVNVATLNAGQSYSAVYTSGVHITANNPIAVMQYARGNNAHSGQGDPAFLALIPTSKFGYNYTFSTTNSSGLNITSHLITLVTKTANTALVTLDGAAYGGAWTTIGTSGWSYSSSTITTGDHVVHSDSLVDVEVYGWGGVTSYAYWVLPDNSAEIPMAVDFLNFDAYQVNSSENTLEWELSQTSNPKSYKILRSINGTEWENIHISAVSESQTKFEFIDNAFSSDVSANYYKLKFIDIDGNTTYSNVEEIINGDSKYEQIVFYPNPVKDEINVTLYSAELDIANLMIFDLTGKLLVKINSNIKKGKNNLQIRDDIKSLENGMYQLKLELSDKTFTKKFHKFSK